jgi:hypothetical protein
MTSTDRNDLMTAQEKLEWVTPKISLMEAEDTEGSGKGLIRAFNVELPTCRNSQYQFCGVGPS